MTESGVMAEAGGVGGWPVDEGRGHEPTVKTPQRMFSPELPTTAVRRWHDGCRSALSAALASEELMYCPVAGPPGGIVLWPIRCKLEM